MITVMTVAALSFTAFACLAVAFLMKLHDVEDEYEDDLAQVSTIVENMHTNFDKLQESYRETAEGLALEVSKANADAIVHSIEIAHLERLVAQREALIATLNDKQSTISTDWYV